MPRCIHAQHMRSAIPYRVDGGAHTITMPIVLGLNSVYHRYELCDEGLMSSHRLPKVKKKATEQED